MAFEHIVKCDDPELVPLARTRIAEIRASGLLFGSQTFKSGGSVVTVRVKGEASYIQVEGGGSILSGLVRNGDIIEIPGPLPADPPVKVMHEFKPTVECGEFVLVHQPSEFMDIKRLAPGATGTKAYVTTVKPSLYSGEMAKVVQILLGYGKTPIEKSGREVKYKHMWAECHGVVRGADNAPWLVYISAAAGVLAMRLPMEAAMTMDSRQKVISETKTLFGGVPSGKDFPTDAKLTAKIDAGTILQLIEPTDQTLIDYFSCQSYSPEMGWSFNDTGSEAHNTCWGANPAGGPELGHHYKIVFTIGALKDKADLQPNEPIADATATITKVHTAHMLPGLMKFGVGATLLPDYSGNLSTIMAAGGARPFVCHINNQLHIVEWYSIASSSFGVKVTGQTSNNGVPAEILYTDRVISSTTRRGTIVNYSHVWWGGPNHGNTVVETVTTTYYFDLLETYVRLNRNGSSIYRVHGVRDAYLWSPGNGGGEHYYVRHWELVNEVAPRSIPQPRFIQFEQDGYTSDSQNDVTVAEAEPSPWEDASWGGHYVQEEIIAGGQNEALRLILPYGSPVTLPTDPRGDRVLSGNVREGGYYFDTVLDRYVFAPVDYYPTTFSPYGTDHYVYPKIVFNGADQDEITEYDSLIANGAFTRVGALFTNVQAIAGDNFHFIGYAE